MNPFSKGMSFLIWFTLFLVYMYMAAFVMSGISEAIKNSSDNASCTNILDLHFTGISLQDATYELRCMGENGRKLYRMAETKQDIIYPISYGLLLSFTLLILSSFCLINKPNIILLAVMPALIIVCDYCENFQIVKMIDQFPHIDANTVTLFSFFNQVKWILFALNLSLIILLGVYSLYKIAKEKRVTKAN